MDYGRAFRICRTAFGLTQAELGDRLQLGTSQVSLIESGKRQPSLKVIKRLSVALDIPHHLLAVLASDADDLKEPMTHDQLSQLGALLVRLLAASHQPPLPLTE